MIFVVAVYLADLGESTGQSGANETGEEIPFTQPDPPTPEHGGTPRMTREEFEDWSSQKTHVILF